MRPEPSEVDLRLGDPRISPIRKSSAIISRRRAKPSEVQTHHHTHGDTQHHKQQNNVQHRVSALLWGPQSGRGHAAKRGGLRFAPCGGRGILVTQQFSDISCHTAVFGRRDSHDLAPPLFAFFGFRPHGDIHHESSFTDPRFVIQLTFQGNVTSPVVGQRGSDRILISGPRASGTAIPARRQFRGQQSSKILERCGHAIPQRTILRGGTPMSFDFWTGVVNLPNVVGILILSGLGTASSAGAG